MAQHGQRSAPLVQPPLLGEQHVRSGDDIHVERRQDQVGPSRSASGHDDQARSTGQCGTLRAPAQQPWGLLDAHHVRLGRADYPHHCGGVIAQRSDVVGQQPHDGHAVTPGDGPGRPRPRARLPGRAAASVTSGIGRNPRPVNVRSSVSRACGISRSPACETPPPMTKMVGSMTAARLASPRPSQRPIAGRSPRAAGSPSRAAAVTTRAGEQLRIVAGQFQQPVRPAPARRRRARGRRGPARVRTRTSPSSRGCRRRSAGRPARRSCARTRSRPRTRRGTAMPPTTRPPPMPVPSVTHTTTAGAAGGRRSGTRPRRPRWRRSRPITGRSDAVRQRIAQRLVAPGEVRREQHGRPVGGDPARRADARPRPPRDGRRARAPRRRSLASVSATSAPGVARSSRSITRPSSSTTPAATLVPPMSTPIGERHPLPPPSAIRVARGGGSRSMCWTRGRPGARGWRSGGSILRGWRRCAFPFSGRWIRGRLGRCRGLIFGPIRVARRPAPAARR